MFLSWSLHLAFISFHFPSLCIKHTGLRKVLLYTYKFVIVLFYSFRFLGRSSIGGAKGQAKLKLKARGYYSVPFASIVFAWTIIVHSAESSSYTAILEWFPLLTIMIHPDLMGVGENWVTQELDTPYWTQTISDSTDSMGPGKCWPIPDDKTQNHAKPKG